MGIRNEKGQFIQREELRKYDGYSVYNDAKGYEIVYISGREIKLHVYMWEKKYGPKPKGHEIHHRNHIKNDNRYENFMLLTNSDHQKVHAGWVMEGGIWTKKPCKDCKQLLPLDNFYQRKGLTPSNHCKECSKTIFQERNTEEYRNERKVYMKSYYKNNKEKWATI